jgi:hypothetical protein
MPRGKTITPAAGLLLALLLLPAPGLRADVNKVENLRGSFAASPDRVSLLWTNPAFSGAAAGLRVYRKEFHSDFTLRTNLPTSASSFVDDAVTNFRFYSYKIVTVDAAGQALAESEVAEVSGASGGKYDLLRFVDNTASLSGGGSVSFYFSVPKSGETLVTVLTPDLATVRVLKRADLEAGTYALSWDCLNEAAAPVIPGL